MRRGETIQFREGLGIYHIYAIGRSRDVIKHRLVKSEPDARVEKKLLALQHPQCEILILGLKGMILSK